MPKRYSKERIKEEMNNAKESRDGYALLSLGLMFLSFFIFLLPIALVALLMAYVKEREYNKWKGML